MHNNVEIVNELKLTYNKLSEKKYLSIMVD